MGPAAELAWALLRDSLAVAAAVATRCDAALWVVHAPDDLEQAFADEVLERAPQASFLAQGGGDLGERLARALGRVAGARLALGMDAPDLSPAHLGRAFDLLEQGHGAVLGPCPDGGYYAIGLGADIDPASLTAGIRWSSPHTYQDTRDALAAAGHTIAALPTHADVDTLDDLRALAGRLAADPAVAPASAVWLRRSAPLPWPV